MDPKKRRTAIPEPLQVAGDPIVKYGFIHMPNSKEFNDYTNSSQVIPITASGKKGFYTPHMFLKDGPFIVGGRGIWDFS